MKLLGYSQAKIKTELDNSHDDIADMTDEELKEDISYTRETREHFEIDPKALKEFKAFENSNLLKFLKATPAWFIRALLVLLIGGIFFLTFWFIREMHWKK